MNIETETYLLCFTREKDQWWHRFIGGYNHVSLLRFCKHRDDLEDLLIITPRLYKMHFGTTTMRDLKLLDYANKLDKFTFLIIKVRSIPKRRLIGIKPQTCATFIQYVVGIDLGTILCQKMYDILTSSKTSYLRKKGILEVKQWEPSTTSLSASQPSQEPTDD